MKIIAQSFEDRYDTADNHRYLVEMSGREFRELLGKSWSEKINPHIGMEANVSAIFSHIQDVRGMKDQLEKAQASLIGALSCIEFAEPIVTRLEEVSREGGAR